MYVVDSTRILIHMHFSSILEKIARGYFEIFSFPYLYTSTHYVSNIRCTGNLLRKRGRVSNAIAPVRKGFFSLLRTNKLFTKLIESYSMLSLGSLKFLEIHVEISRTVWSIDFSLISIFMNLKDCFRSFPSAKSMEIR